MIASNITVTIGKTSGGWPVLSAVALLCVSTAWAQIEGSSASAAEQELFRRTNRERERAGVPVLEWNEWLAQAARQHAEEMARRGALSHRFPGEPSLRDRLASTPLRFNASAENVAFGADVDDIHTGWMTSAGHRANILNPKYNAIGIGVARRGKYLYATQNFAHRIASHSNNDLEDAVAAAVEQVRREQRFPHMRRLETPSLRRAACEMAKKNKLSPSAVLQESGQFRSAVTFTEGDPEEFSRHLDRLRSGGPYRGYAVGACFARNEKYPEGTNWVVVGLF
jgi:uncharacterized protein YkwD